MKYILAKALAYLSASSMLVATEPVVAVTKTEEPAPIVQMKEEIIEEIEQEEIEQEEIKENYTMVKKTASTSKIKDFGYWCYRPTESKDEELPLVIYLHGLDGCGSNLDKLLQIEGIPYYINNGQLYPNAIVISPQCPSGKKWAGLTSDVMELIEQVVEEEKVDRSKISITGASLGGIGTFRMALAYPDYFSAIVPVCASVNAGSCSKLTNLPTRIYHGTKDYGMGFSVKTAAQVIKDNGGNCELTMLEGEGHEIRHVYVDEEYDILNWMISQQREDMTEEVVEEAVPLTVDMSTTVSQ